MVTLILIHVAPWASQSLILQAIHGHERRPPTCGMDRSFQDIPWNVVASVGGPTPFNISGLSLSAGNSDDHTSAGRQTPSQIHENCSWSTS